MDGVSRGYSLYFRETDYGEYNVANYLTNSMGGGVQFGYPISDTQRIGLNLNFDNTDIDPGSLAFARDSRLSCLGRNSV